MKCKCICYLIYIYICLLYLITMHESSDAILGQFIDICKKVNKYNLYMSPDIAENFLDAEIRSQKSASSGYFSITRTHNYDYGDKELHEVLVKAFDFVDIISVIHNGSSEEELVYEQFLSGSLAKILQRPQLPEEKEILRKKYESLRTHYFNEIKNDPIAFLSKFKQITIRGMKINNRYGYRDVDAYYSNISFVNDAETKKVNQISVHNYATGQHYPCAKSVISIMLDMLNGYPSSGTLSDFNRVIAKIRNHKNYSENWTDSLLGTDISTHSFAPKYDEERVKKSWDNDIYRYISFTKTSSDKIDEKNAIKDEMLSYLENKCLSNITISSKGEEKVDTVVYYRYIDDYEMEDPNNSERCNKRQKKIRRKYIRKTNRNVTHFLSNFNAISFSLFPRYEIDSYRIIISYKLDGDKITKTITENYLFDNCADHEIINHMINIVS